MAEVSGAYDLVRGLLLCSVPQVKRLASRRAAARFSVIAVGLQTRTAGSHVVCWLLACKIEPWHL